LQFTPADTQSKIAKEYVFANAEKDKIQWLTKYKKHRADKGFREFSAFNKHSACLTVKCFEMPYDFLYRPLHAISMVVLFLQTALPYLRSAASS
jgi:hypothetical protein